MPKSILICAPLLLAPLFAASAPGMAGALPGSAPAAKAPPDEVMKDSDHKKVGELIGDCIKASIARTGKHKATTKLRKALDKKWAKKAESKDPLSLTEDLQAALYYSINYSKAKGVKKGKVAKIEIPARFYGKEFTTTFALWAPSKYNARQGPYPLVLCIPDADETPHEHLTEKWADNELRKVCILVALQMPEKLENWGGRGVQGDPENTGGYGLLMTTLAYVRDRYAIDFDKVFIAGRGVGVAAAMEIANSSAHRFAGVIGRTGDAAEISPDNLSNLPIFFAGGGKKATAYAEQAKALGYLEPTIVADAKEADILAWIQQTSRRSHPDSVVLRAGAPMPNAAYWLEVPQHDGLSLARLTAKADRGTNTITIESEGITRVTLFFNDILLDLEKPVKVIVNGVEHENNIPRNFTTTMDLIYRSRSDPGKLYTAVKSYDIPAKE